MFFYLFYQFTFSNNFSKHITFFYTQIIVDSSH